jgi:hypothetical protein
MTRAAGLRDVITGSWVLRVTAGLAVVAVGALALRIVLVNAFAYVNWADALTYAEGARRILGGSSPYSEMQLAGPYPLDHASFGLGFVYPPSGAYLLAPFVVGEPFWYAWNALSLVALCGIVLLIVSREFGRLTLAASVVVVAGTVAVFLPGLTDLKTGYLSPMIAAATGAMWLWPRLSAVPALLFGLIKVFPAAGLLWTFRMGGEWRWPALGAAAILTLVTIGNPGYVLEWVRAVANAQPACPEFSLVSFGCLGVPIVGYLLAGLALVVAWRTEKDDVSFLWLGLAMTIALPDLYWGNLMVAMVAAIPLLARVAHGWWGPTPVVDPGLSGP